MATENYILREQSRQSLKGKWGNAALFVFVIAIINGVLSNIPFLGTLISLIISGPLALGSAFYFMNISRDKEAKIDNIFSGFKNFGTGLAAYILMAIFIFLWSLLLIIPGIIAGLSYSMTYFIINDNPTIGPLEAIDKSKEMMKGYKMKLFLLHLSFLGWAILCIFTLFIGFFWLAPYMQVSLVKFYEDIKGSEETQLLENDQIE